MEPSSNNSNSIELEEKTDSSQVLVELINDVQTSKSIPLVIKQQADNLLKEVQLDLLNNQKDFYTKEEYDFIVICADNTRCLLEELKTKKESYWHQRSLVTNFVNYQKRLDLILHRIRRPLEAACRADKNFSKKWKWTTATGSVRGTTVALAFGTLLACHLHPAVALQLTVEAIALSSKNIHFSTLTTCYKGIASIALVCTAVGALLKGQRFRRLQQVMRDIGDHMKASASASIGYIDKFISASSDKEEREVLEQITSLVDPLAKNTSDLKSLNPFLSDRKLLEERLESDREAIRKLKRDIYYTQYDHQGKLRA
jgi:hypothetical protein